MTDLSRRRLFGTADRVILKIELVERADAHL